MTNQDRIKELETEMKEIVEALEMEDYGSYVYDRLSVDLWELEIEMRELNPNFK